MSIDVFDTKRFEAALPKDKNGNNLWNYAGFEDNERMYVVYAGPFARVVVRSSIDESGFAAESGQDSIRLWLEILTDSGTCQAVKKLDAWTTRVPGWEGRMIEKMRQLYRYGIKVKRELPHGQQFWFVKKGPNEGRPCSKNINKNSGFTWMDVPEFSTPEPEPDNNWQLSVVSKQVDDSLVELSERSDSIEQNSSGEQSRVSTPDAKPKVEEQGTNTFLDDLNAMVEKEFQKKESPADIRPSSQQAAAIYAPIDVPIRMIASAGSGKTLTLKLRYQYLLSKGFRPEDLVVVTFTKDMSKDMANQIVMLNPEIAGTPGEAQICSIHAFCNRVLQAEGIGRKIPNKSWEVKRLLQKLAKELWTYSDENDKSTCRPSWEELASAFATAKYQCIQMGEDNELYNALWGGYHAERLTRAREQFDLTMRGKRWWTFSDMLFEMEVRLNEDVSFRQRCQEHFKYIMIDEGQDTNGQAMRILTMIAEPNNLLFIVGDPDQLLFRFTGATPEENLYDGFSKRYENGLTFFLETNYRSTHTIVDKSNMLIANNYEAAGGPYDEVFRKVCTATDDAGEGEEIFFDMYEDAQEEAKVVAESVLSMINDGVEPNEIFIASRTRAQLGYLEPPLTKAGVPFINITGGSFWMLRHVQYILSYLRLAKDGSDADAFKRIYNVASNNMLDRYGEYCPTRWLGNSFLREMDRTYNSEKARKASWQYNGWRDGIADLVWTMDHMELFVEGGHSEGASPASMVRWLIDNSIAKYLREEEGIKNNDDIGKLADLEAVYDIAGQFDTLEGFFERIDGAIQAAKDAKSKNWEKYVVLSTVHRLKGMERPVVFGIGWCEGEKISQSQVAQPVGLLPHTYSLIEPPQTGVLNMGGKGNIYDERCIGYVLITRAQKQVFLSGFRAHRGARMWPSRFIKDLHLVE